MGEPIKEPILEPNTELQTPTPQEPITPPVQDPKPEPPQVDNREDIINLLSTVGKDVLLKVPSIQRLLEETRQQEKDKLYNTIASKDNELKTQNDTIEDLKKQVDAKGEESMANEKELMAKIQELSAGQQALLQQIADEKEANRLTNLANYKKDKIAEAKGEIIEALVVGDSEEAIDQAVEVAKAEYQKIVAPLQQQIVDSQKPDIQNAPSPINPTPAPIVQATSNSVKAMSLEDYAKQRESLLNSIKN